MGPDGVSIQQPHDCLLNRRPVNSPHKWPVTRKMFSFDDVIMCLLIQCSAAITRPIFSKMFSTDTPKLVRKGRLLWIQTLIYLMPDSMQCCRNTLLIASRCTNGTDCTCLNISAGLSCEARGDGRVVGYDARHISGRRSCQHMKQFAHSWYLPGCQCTGHVLMPPSF